MPLPAGVKLNDPSLFIEKKQIKSAWVTLDSSTTFKVENPATEEKIGTCAEFTRDETNATIETAYEAFQLFQNTTARERSHLLRRWHDLIIQHLDDLSILITLENGKSLADARGEVLYAASFLEWFSEEAPRSYGEVIPYTKQGSQVITIKEPVGVCVLVTPWNFPAAMITRKAGAAIAAGCTVVIKSPAETPFTVNALVELSLRAGLPKGVVNVITAMDNTIDIVHTLTSSPLIHKVSFTGSTQVGKILMKQCAETTLKKISLELGGNAPFIVFSDADVDAAVAGAIFCKFRSSGQTCVSANRFFVHDDIYDEFLTKLAARVQGDLLLGHGLTVSGVNQGPLIDERAVVKAQTHVQDAVSNGAKVLIGGKSVPRLGPRFFEPTILTEVTMAMRIANEETFGPIAGLFRFREEAEVIEMANNTEFGLAGYFYSRDHQRIWRVARALQMGMVGVNTGLISDASAP